MEFKRFDVILNADEMQTLGHAGTDIRPDMRFAFRRNDIDWLTVSFTAVRDDATSTLEDLKMHKHLAKDTERVFTVQSNKTVAENALADIAAFKEKLEKRQHNNSIKRHFGLFLEPPIDYDNVPDPAS